MKITFIIHSLNNMGGAEKILVLLANHLVTKKHNISIVTLSDSNPIFKLDERIELIKMKKNEKNSFIVKKLEENMSFLKNINHIRSINKPDILVSFISSTNILSIISAKLMKIPIVTSEHSSYHLTLTIGRSKLSSLVWKLLRRITYPKVNHHIILTEEDKPKYHYVPNLSIIKNPLVLSNKHSNIQREKIILGVGSLEPIKGFDMLIDAFSKLNLKGWKLLIAGKGSQQASLQTQIKTLNMSNSIQLLGLVDDMELYYKRASIYVLSSRSEGFPGALCEAMGYGCACIAFNCPTGPKEIINEGIDGLLIEENNVTNLSQTIEMLSNNKKYRERLGLESQKISNRLNIENISQKWEVIFNDIIKKGIN